MVEVGVAIVELVDHSVSPDSFVISFNVVFLRSILFIGVFVALVRFI